MIEGKQFKYKYLEILLIALMLFFFGSEAYNKLSWFNIYEKSDLQKFVKAFAFGMFIIGLLLKNYKSFLYCLGLVLIFTLGQWQLIDGFSKESLLYLLKYLFPIFLFYFFNKIKWSSGKRLFQVYEYLIIFNSLLIIIGFIFSIKYFKTYSGERFGFSGLMITSATATYFYCIALFYFFVRYEKELIFNLKFIICLIASVLIGTKSIYLFIALLSAFYIYQYINSKKLRLGLLIMVIIGALVATTYLFYFNSLFSEIRDSDGILSSVLSFRDQLFVKNTLPFIKENWSGWNYFFGGATDFEIRPQLEFFDLFFFWGVIGTLVYLFLFYKSYQPLTLSKLERLFFIGSFFIIIFLAGNFFYNASIPIYLLIIKEYAFYKKSNEVIN